MGLYDLAWLVAFGDTLILFFLLVLIVVFGRIIKRLEGSRHD